MSERTKKRSILPIGFLVIALCITAVITIGGMAAAESEEVAPMDDQPAAPMTDDATAFKGRIEVVAMSCAACHGTEGRFRTEIPSLAGQPAPVMQAQLLAFKQDLMPSATVMPRLAKGFSDEELVALAAYFSALKPDKIPGDE